jgi:pyruvate formate lyase activating enzyme
MMNHVAKYWNPVSGQLVECVLCPHNCIVAPGKSGKCRVRKNLDGKLISTVYGKLCSYAFDPVEKKPLYHFFPGKEILSLGSVGCNLRCAFCQNETISQASAETFPRLYEVSPNDIVALALSRPNNIGVAYTYNEPVVWFEFMMDCAREVQKAGMKNVVVTNGFIAKDPLSELIKVADAFSVDLKGFTEEFYAKMTGSALAPVLDSLRQIKASGRHLEVVNLVVPGKNDNPVTFSEMIKFIHDELGKDTVLHLNRYYPHYQMTDPPTPVATMIELHDLAKKHLTNVYLGNMPYRK